MVRSNGIKLSIFDKQDKLLGSGVTGKVLLYNGHSLYAIKYYTCKEPYETFKDYKTRVYHEYDILQRLHHFNIITVYKFSTSIFNAKVGLIMEYGGVAITNILKKAAFSELLCCYKQILNGVQYIHDHGIVHRDLKFANILINQQGVIKIIDFFDADDKVENFGIVGTDKFVAPEIFSKLKYNGLKSDIWSLGIMLYYIVYKKYPWKLAKSDDEKFNTFLTHGLDIDNLPKQLQVCLSNMITVDQHRWTISDVMNNPWISRLSSCKLDDVCGSDHGRLFSQS